MRGFLAIPLAERERRAAVAARDSLRISARGFRFVRDEGLHITMRFLGEVDPSRRGDLDEAMCVAAGVTGRLALRLSGAAVFPQGGRPRVLWLPVLDETPDGRLCGLAERIERAARAVGFSPEVRPFAAHVTLGRVRHGVRVTVPPLDRVGDLGPFVADRLVLYRSDLGPGGSLYSEEASYPFENGGAA